MRIDHILVTPIKLVSEANMREHWALKNKRKKSQQQMLQACWIKAGLLDFVWAFPLKITFTRIGVRKLDSDNLAGSGKAVRDQIAKLLNVNDGDESKVTWHYEQRKGSPKQYGLEIHFESA